MLEFLGLGKLLILVGPRENLFVITIELVASHENQTNPFVFNFILIQINPYAGESRRPLNDSCKETTNMLVVGIMLALC